jgi:hypothetical protein
MRRTLMAMTLAVLGGGWAMTRTTERATVAPVPTPTPSAPQATAEDDPLENVHHCSDNSFRRQHQACFRRELAKVPSEQREKAYVAEFVAKMPPLQAETDRLEREALARDARMEQLTLDLVRTSKNAAELAQVAIKVWAACAGHHDKLQIGMTEDEAMGTDWCFPFSAHETITAGHVRRQLVYHTEIGGEQWGNGDEGFLYFDDGRLVAIEK